MTASWVTAGGVLACALLFGCHAGDGAASSSRRDPPTASIATLKTDTGVVEETLETYGKVEFTSDQQRSIPFGRPGQVMAVSVLEGQMVNKSAELLRLGAVPRRSPEVQQAAIAAEFAGREVARVKRVVGEGLATNKELDRAEKELAAAQAALRGLGGGSPDGGVVMRASMDGIVAKVLVHSGDVVQAGQTALMLAPRDAMSVRVGFEVEELPRLFEGLAVRISSAYRGENDRAADATLSTLHRVVDPKTQLVEGVILVNDPPAWMAPGLWVRVVVVLAAHPHAVRVPRAALIQQGGSAGVFVVDQGHASWRVLRLGFGDAEKVEVVSGLQDGDSVATTGRTSLSDGVAVRVMTKDVP